VDESGSSNKSFVISKRLVWEAYERVAANKGAAGVDGQTLDDFEADLENNLYKIWNRMSSGSYFPPPVMAVEIPKPHGEGTRVLGIPTVADRVAQTVVAMQLETRTEAIFVDDSYGYRRGRSALDAVETCRKRCWKKDWVIDLDVAGFFDSVDHDLLIKAVEVNTDHKWVVLYVKRWLKAPLAQPDGTLVERDRGTPQGSAVSPVLANLFLHYAFDLWMGREFPTVEFERYADDVVVHCVTERQARSVLGAITRRMVEVGLLLHPDKTKIVYCKDDKRRGSFDVTSFVFLGFMFCRRSIRTRQGVLFSGFMPAISPAALKAINRKVRRWRLHRRTRLDLAGLAERINPIVRGWINYYGRFYRSQLYRLLRRINAYLVRWARNKYRRLVSFKRVNQWWRRLVNRQPDLFTHWRWTTNFEWTQ